MRLDREIPDVEFLAGAVDAADDEDLPERPGREFPHLRRLRKPVGYLALAALAVTGVVKLATLSGSGVATAAGPAHSSASSSTRTVPRSVRLGSLTRQTVLTAQPSVDVVRRPATSWGLISDDPNACPGNETCSTAYDVPEPVLAAIRAAYPGARVVSTTTVSVVGAYDSMLLSRSVRATAGPRQIDIQLLPFITGGPDTHRHQTEGPNTLVSVQSSAIAYTAEVTVVEPVSRTPSDRIALRLAHDPRLTATT